MFAPRDAGMCYQGNSRLFCCILTPLLEGIVILKFYHLLLFLIGGVQICLSIKSGQIIIHMARINPPCYELIDSYAFRGQQS